MSRTHHDTITQNHFSALKKSPVLHLFIPAPPSPSCPLTTTDVSTAYPLSLPESHAVGIIKHVTFQTRFLHCATWICVSAMFFHGLTAGTSLSLSNIPLPTRTTPSLSAHLVKHIMAAPSLRRLWNAFQLQKWEGVDVPSKGGQLGLRGEMEAKVRCFMSRRYVANFQLGQTHPVAGNEAYLRGPPR